MPIETPDYLNSYEKQQLEEFRAEARLREDTITQLRSDGRVQARLMPYSEKDREEFIRYYAEQKLRFIHDARELAQEELRVSRQFEKQARKLFWYIQQQKLYALQLQWRARVLELPGITIGQQFDELAENIAHCPLIEPVTAAELALLQEYLASPECTEGYFADFGHDFQKYDHIKDELPAWYTFCFRHTGTMHLLHLPNLRGEEEELYFDLAHEAEKAKAKAARELRQEPEPAPHVPDRRPMWYDHRKEVYGQLIRRFDWDPRLPELRRAWDDAESDDERLDDEVTMAPDVLQEVPGPLPLEANDDWRVAIKELAAATRRKYISLALGEVYEEYREALESGTLAEWEKPVEEGTGLVNFLLRRYETGKQVAAEKGLTP